MQLQNRKQNTDEVSKKGLGLRKKAQALSLFIGCQEVMTQNKEMSIKMFDVISVIGRGAYAKVLLARCLLDDCLYAVKVLKKQYIMEKNQEKQIMTQKEILSKIDHPFLVKLKMSFQDQKKLYFVLEYCPGGQLFTILSQRDKLSEDQTKFYSGQIVLALDALHQHNVIYRDLKAENVILDNYGYIKLTDFGLSKILAKEQNALSICGTSEYLAPEMILKTGHGVDVDWWCLGCLIYEMVLGYPPFESPNRNQLFEMIVFKNPSFTGASEHLADLLKKLLAKDPEKRLGHNSVDEIKTHPWFQKLKWKSLLARKYKAPFIPNLTSEIDTTNFDVQFTRSSIESDDEIPFSLEGKDTNFKDFSFG